MKTKKDMSFAAVTTVFAVVAVALTFGGGFNLGATVSCVLLFFLATAYVADNPNRPSPFSCLCGILALMASLVYTFSNDTVFRLLGGFLIPELMTIYFVGLGGNGRHWEGGYAHMVDVLRTIFVLPFAHMGTAMRAVFTRQSGKRSGKAGKILIGLAAAIPVLIIVIPLLIRADEAFSDFMMGIIDCFNLSERVVEIILGVMIAPFLFTALYALRHQLDRPAPATAANPAKHSKINSIVVTSFLGAISFFYLLYLFSQLAYFFNGFAGILPSGWNVVNYAKRGFFEMGVIASINLAVIFVSTVAVCRPVAGVLPIQVKILNLFISLFTLLLIATAQSKMFMYIGRFGMTRLRLLTSLFMWFLTLIYLAVIIRLFIRRFPYMKVIALAGAILFILPWGLSPVRCDLNSIVCSYNISAYKSGKIFDLDITYLSYLGDSAIPYLIELADDSSLPEWAREQATNILRDKAMHWYVEATGFRGYNYSRATRNQVLKDWAEQHNFPFATKRADPW